MKTKFLLFALLMLLPWCAKAQMQETVYRVSLTDLPEDLNMEDLDEKQSHSICPVPCILSCMKLAKPNYG